MSFLFFTWCVVHWRTCLWGIFAKNLKNVSRIYLFRFQASKGEKKRLQFLATIVFKTMDEQRDKKMIDWIFISTLACNLLKHHSAFIVTRSLGKPVAQQQINRRKSYSITWQKKLINQMKKNWLGGSSFESHCCCEFIECFDQICYCKRCDLTACKFLEFIIKTIRTATTAIEAESFYGQ